MKECENCKQRFHSERSIQKYCSRDCYTVANNRRQLKPQVEKKCDNCFGKIVTANKRKRFCSRSCSRTVAAKKREKNKTGTTYYTNKCSVCKTEFVSVRGTTKFCSEPCRRVARRIDTDKKESRDRFNASSGNAPVRDWKLIQIKHRDKLDLRNSEYKNEIENFLRIKPAKYIICDAPLQFQFETHDEFLEKMILNEPRIDNFY